MKTCKRCGKSKAITDFDVTEGNGRRHVCKECRSSYQKEWRIRSKDILRQKKKDYHQAHREQIIARVNEWVKNNPEQRNKNALAYYYRLQEQAINAYGGYVCACCGETEPLFMTLDHINNDGREDRKKMGCTGGAKLYKWLKDHKYPSRYQVLCMNCNHGKYRNNGICPHHG